MALIEWIKNRISPDLHIELDELINEEKLSGNRLKSIFDQLQDSEKERAYLDRIIGIIKGGVPSEKTHRDSLIPRLKEFQEALERNRTQNEKLKRLMIIHQQILLSFMTKKERWDRRKKILHQSLLTTIRPIYNDISSLEQQLTNVLNAIIKQKEINDNLTLQINELKVIVY